MASNGFATSMFSVEDESWLTLWLRSLDLHKVVALSLPQPAHSLALAQLSQQNLQVALEAKHLGGLADVLWEGIIDLRERMKSESSPAAENRTRGGAAAPIGTGRFMNNSTDQKVKKVGFSVSDGF